MTTIGVNVAEQPIAVTETNDGIVRVDVTGGRGPIGETGDPGTTSWGGITDKPDVIGAGATQQEARGAIGAGTSSLVLGTGAGEAKPGNYAPTLSDIVGSGAAGRDVLAKATVAEIISLLGVATPADVSAAIHALVGAAPGSLDTLAEVAAAFQNNPDVIGEIFTALAARVLTSDPRLSDARTPTDNTVSTAKIISEAVTLAKLSLAVQASLAKADSAMQRDSNSNVAVNAVLVNGATTATSAGTTTLTVGSAKKQVFTGIANHTVVLPATGVVAYQDWEIVNLSAGVLTINASVGALFATLNPGAVITANALQATPTAAAHWYPS